MKNAIRGSVQALLMTLALTCCGAGLAMNTAVLPKAGLAAGSPSPAAAATSLPRFTEYIVVRNSDWDRFRTDVTNRITEGYLPVGGIATTADGQAVQALAR
jgi:hypothetical protein